MTQSEFVVQRSSTASRKDFEDDEEEEEEEEEEEGYSSSVVGEGNEKPAKKTKNESASRRFRCMSRRASNIIGLPKRPDTKFRQQEFYARIRSSISRKCRMSGAPLFSGVPREAMANSKGSNNSFKIYDPGSPDVSCLGRIKLKQKDLKTLTSSRREDRGPWRAEGCEGPKKGRFSWLKKLFSAKKKVSDSNRGGAAESPCHDDVEVESSRPSLTSCPQFSNLKRFASQREPGALANFSADDFDARPANGSALNLSERENEETKKQKGDPAKVDVLGLDVYDDIVDGRLSKSISVNEINLWKRRSVAPPGALELKNLYGCGFDMRRPMTV